MSKTMRTMDGNEAAAYVSYAFTDVATIYPITPSSPMAELVDLWSAQGKKNIFGQTVKVSELQSEAGASGAMHGSLQGGALTTTYTASQGLLLMIPNMYKMAGELLPGVFHVSARALATQALSIFGDHQDVMATRQTGFALLASSSVQEVMDLGGIAHLAAIKTRVPFVHFFDGFRNSHEIQKIEVMDYSVFEKLIDYNEVRRFRNRSLNPCRPVLRGTAQNPDIYFQNREACNPYYEDVADVVNDYMKKISKEISRDYAPFKYYGHEDADRIIIAMGSVCDTIEETIDYLMDKGEKVGLLKVHLYRPFSKKYFMQAMPKNVAKISVLDRTKEPGALGEPLYEDVRNLYYDMDTRPIIVGGRYGLGSKDTTPSQIKAVFDNIKGVNPKNNFTIGIVDDLTNTSLNSLENINTTPIGTMSCKLWGLGSDGTVGANKMAIKIIGNNTDLYAQGYFSYDSKKSGGTTVSHLRFGKKRIKSEYLVEEADYIACHNRSYVYHYDLLKGIKKGGIFVLNCPWSKDELDEKLPAQLKRSIADNGVDFYIIDAVNIANDIGLGGRINMIMQSAFFKLTNVIPIEDATTYLKKDIEKAYGKKGEKIVRMNNEAVDRGINSIVKVDVPDNWKYVDKDKSVQRAEPKFIKDILRPMSKLEGDDLPVSTFKDMADGTFPLGTTAFEKRGIAVTIPQWIVDNCIQCNQCAYICPHAVIRPFLLTEDETKAAPKGFEVKKAIGKELGEYNYKIQVSPLDCTGCGNCADICPAPKGKALIMVNAEEEIVKEDQNWKYANEVVGYKEEIVPKTTVKGSQFMQPLLEFSGACAGCGETAYLKLVTQLFGDRMVISNATGCSSIWGGSAPSVPFTHNSCGHGPAWANSLFEDNAEFGFGMHLASAQLREKLRDLILEALDKQQDTELSKSMNRWVDTMYQGEENKTASNELIEKLEAVENRDDLLEEIYNKRDFLVKQSQWIVGGDGWAYDIGFGGLDQVLASGEDVNVLVLDTEVYSNTGGQSSKATPIAAAAKFAASGKKIRKKDLGLMAMSYGYVYVGSISMGANYNHTIKTILEAESYPGPSLIIAYAPCIAHGIKSGMSTTVVQEKKAVEAGYWHLYRYNPTLKKENLNPFILDSKKPKASFKDFIMGEIRYSQVENTFPEIAHRLYALAEIDSKEKYKIYRLHSEMDFSEN